MKFSTFSSLCALVFLLPAALWSQGCVTASTGSLTYDGEDFRDRPTLYYTPGDSVEVCFSLDNEFVTADNEWVHSIIIAEVGPGFNLASVVGSGDPPAACQAGTWAFYETWSRCGGNLSCPGPTTFFNGYAFDSPAGLTDACSGATANDGDPGNNYGDGDGACGLVFCFKLETLDPGGAPPADAYSVSVQVYADGVTGSYTGSAGPCGGPCQRDVAVCFPEIGEIDALVLNEPCPGDLFDVQAFFVDGGGFFGLDVIWRDGNDIVAMGETASLPEGNYTIEVSRPNCAPQTFDVELDLSIPVLEYTGPEDGDFICYGEPIDMAITVTNVTVNSITWTLDGNPVSSGTSYSIAEATPADAGEYTVEVNFGDNCDTTIVFDLLVGNNVVVDITPADTAVCELDIVTFSVAQSNGAPFPDDFTLLWDGGAGDGTSYTFEAFGTGPSIMALQIIDGDGCVFDFEHPYTVNALPEATVSDELQNICFGESATITATATSGLAPFNFVWEPLNVVTGPVYTVEPPYDMHLVDVFVRITDANGCINFSPAATVVLNNSPTRPTIDCTPICVSELMFSWNSPSATFYQLFVRTNGGVETLLADNYTETEYLFTGLNPGDEVELRVVPYAGDAMNSCVGPDRSESCITPLTSTPGFVVGFPAVVCTESTGGTVELEVAAGEPGTFTLTSASLGLNNEPADADGSTTITLPALSGTDNAETHNITIAYAGVGGRCPADTTVELTVARAPAAEFSLDRMEACGFSETFTATLTSAATSTDVYDLNLEDPIVGSVSNTGSGSWTVTIDSAGTHNLVLTTENGLNAACVDTFRAQVTLNEPSPAPVIQCGAVGLDFVNFIWNDTGHDSYTVNEVDVPDGAVVTQNGNAVSITNLSVGDMVTISVSGVSAGCPDVVSEPQTCVAESCPDITLTINDPGVFCADDNQVIDLGVTADGSDGTGTLSWEIDNTPFNGSFNPSVLGPGSYTIDALLDEGCDFRASRQLTINAVPSALFTLPDGPICTDEEVLGAAAGAVQAGFTYDFSAPGATVTAGNDAASRNFSWNAPGRYFVSLTVTSDQNCVSETVTDSIDVVAPLTSPVVTCDTADMEFVAFSWPAYPDGNSFLVTVNNGAAFAQDSNTLFVGGLGINETVNISVEVIDDGPCANPAPGNAACTTVSCPQLALTPPADTLFCTIDAPLRYPLTAAVSGDNGGGTLTFSGDGVVQVGPDYFFDLDTAGVGTHVITVDFEEGMCTGTATFVYTVNPTPESTFQVNGVNSSDDLNAEVPNITICAGEEFSFEYTGNLTAADSALFCYSYTPEEPDAIDTVGFESYVCRFPDPGVYRICLEVKLDSCTSTKNYFDIICEAPLTPPLVSCQAVGFDAIEFTWSGGGSGGYRLLFDDGLMEITTDQSYLATGLQPGETFGLDVYDLTANACGEAGSPGRVECSTDPCPLLEADLSSVPESICILDGTETVDLSGITVTGGQGNGVFSFSGEGVSQSTFDAASVDFGEAGTTYTIGLSYEEPGPCRLDTTLEITVFRRPMAFFFEPGEQCLGDTTLIRVGSTNFVSGNDVTVDFADGTVVPDNDPDDTEYRVVFPSAGTRTLTATVISNISGCPSEQATLDVVVVAPLPAPELTCGTATLESVEVTWPDIPGATGYVLVASNGDFTDLPAGATSYTINNLAPSTDIEVTVTASGGAPCGDSPAAMISCRTMDCPGGVVRVDTPAGSQCLDGTEAPVLLEASLTSGEAFNGPVTWAGTGVVANTDGTFSFDPAGLDAGDYQITVNYDGPANCDSEASVVLTLNDASTVAFNTMPARLCQGEEFNLFFTGTAQDGDTFSWDFDGAVVDDLGNENFQLRWDTPGNRTVSLTLDGNCGATASFTVTVIPTLDAPQVTCARQDLDGVLFTWPAVTAASEGYRVSINGGDYGPVQTETEFFVGDLAFGEIVTIQVISVRSGTNCDESAPSVAVDCAARVCPEVNLAPSAEQTSFCDEDTAREALAANLSGDDGTGELTWEGSGVVNDNGSFFFDPVAAGVGSHTLTVTYTQETLCVYSETIVMTVNASPAAGIVQSADLSCAGTAVTFSLSGTPDPETTYTFDFGGAGVTELGGENYEAIFPAAGEFEVLLSAERNGCTSFASTMITIQDEVFAGTPVSGVLEVCAGSAEPIDLSTRLVNATAGGEWSAVSGVVPGGSLNAATGVLNPAGLGAGDYTFAYTVDGGACPEDAAEVLLRLLAPPAADAGPDQRLTCNMGMVSLNGSNSETGDGYAYLWTSTDPDIVITDADQQMIDVGQPGVYQLRVTNAIGCSAVDEVTVTAETEAPVMELEVSNITCFSSDNGAISVTNVNGGRAPYRFSVNGEDRGQSTLFANLAPGSYDIQITDANGCFSNVILDLTQPDELTVRLQFPGDSAVTTAGTDIFISASVNGGNPIDTLIWQPDSIRSGDGLNGIEFTATETQMISVTVVDELGCTATDRMMLLVRRDRPVYFPTAFSPNGDNTNDVFFIGGDLDQIDFISDFRIFNRWGEAVYSGLQDRANAATGGNGFLPNDPAFGWDGTLNGKAMNPQVFVYTATVHFSDGEVIVYKGDFVLMR